MRYRTLKVVCLVLVAALSCVFLGSAIAGKPTRSKRRVPPAPPGTKSNPLVKNFGFDPNAWVQSRINKGRTEHLNTWRGTTVTPHFDATGEVLALHQRIAAAFVRDDPPVNGRLGRYQWLQDQDNAIKIMGWNAQIMETSVSPNGALVKLVVRPHIVAENHTSLFTQDNHIEWWNYSPDGHLAFLRTDDSPTASQSLISD